jgi:hypothetical protein
MDKLINYTAGEVKVISCLWSDENKLFGEN